MAAVPATFVAARYEDCDFAVADVNKVDMSKLCARLAAKGNYKNSKTEKALDDAKVKKRQWLGRLHAAKQARIGVPAPDACGGAVGGAAG